MDEQGAGKPQNKASKSVRKLKQWDGGSPMSPSKKHIQLLFTAPISIKEMVDHMRVVKVGEIGSVTSKHGLAETDGDGTPWLGAIGTNPHRFTTPIVKLGPPSSKVGDRVFFKE
ncbi:hypothetical protein Ancab_033966 [Ancistrocladus abbreviatus]